MPEAQDRRGLTVPTSLLIAQADLLEEQLKKLQETLTDEEAYWEPVQGCWSIRRQADGRMRMDWTPDPPNPPFTTIAWRLEHIGQSLAVHAQRLFDQGSFSFKAHEPAGDLEGAMQFIENSFRSWRAGIADAGDSVADDLALEVIQLNGHHLRHLAEIDTVRDLYRAGRPLDPDPFVDACLRGDEQALVALREKEFSSAQPLVERNSDLLLTASRMGYWHVLNILIEMGFPVNCDGTASPLHYAAAFAPLETVRLLVERGGDLECLDSEWNSTPAGWAEFFGQQETADYLRSVSKSE